MAKFKGMSEAESISTLYIYHSDPYYWDIVGSSEMKFVWTYRSKSGYHSPQVISVLQPNLMVRT